MTDIYEEYVYIDDTWEKLGTTQDVLIPVATENTVGVVQPDGETITVDGDGVISAAGGGGSAMTPDDVDYIYGYIDANRHEHFIDTLKIALHRNAEDTSKNYTYFSLIDPDDYIFDDMEVMADPDDIDALKVVYKGDTLSAGDWLIVLGGLVTCSGPWTQSISAKWGLYKNGALVHSDSGDRQMCDDSGTPYENKNVLFSGDYLTTDIEYGDILQLKPTISDYTGETSNTPVVEYEFRAVTFRFEQPEPEMSE